ncbi:MAG: aryl-sulfate sulfotransferase, partial [Candidatus Marinimicrobia bacterium]|nr:aryl-sulfate sulfotransferase [Candidatus Neomarinimicrobiota bacterium]
MMRYSSLLFAVIALLPGKVIKAEWLPEDERSLNYTQVLFSWDQMPGALAYELEVSEDGGVPVINYIDSTLTCIIDEELEWGLSYSWRVRPIYPDDIAGEWSAVRHFYILELPGDRPEFSVENMIPDSVSPGLTMLNVNARGFAMGVDQWGALKWYLDASLYPDRFRITQFLPNGHFMVYKSSYGHGREVALNGTIHWQVDRTDMHHEIIKKGPNRYMGIVQKTVQALKYAAVSEDSSWNYNIIWRGDDILEFDEDGTVVWSWSTFDHFSMEDYHGAKLTGVGPGGTTDWTHSNAIHFDSTESAIYFSSRNISRITKIDYPSGDVIWMMGDSLASGDVTVGTDIGFNFQHSIKKLANGNLLMFDNGILTYSDGIYSDRKRSRGLEIAVTSTDSGYQAEVVWQYILPESMYGRLMGDCDRLPNGNTMMTTGSSGYIVEVTPDSQMVWYLDLGIKQLYRSERIPNLYPQAHSVIGPDFTDSNSVRLIYSRALADSLQFEFINEGWADQSYNYRLLTDGATPDQSGQINIPPGASKKVLLPFVFDLPGEPINLQWIVTHSSASGVSDTIQYRIRHLNIPPRITSADSAFALEGSPFVYRATAVDADDSTLTWTFPVLPSWLTAQTDMVYGTPLEGTQDTTFTSIVSDGEFSDTLSIALLILSTNERPAITSLGSAEAIE